MNCLRGRRRSCASKDGTRKRHSDAEFNLDLLCIPQNWIDLLVKPIPPPPQPPYSSTLALMAGTFTDSSHAPNFIIFGEMGVGKSSLINLIAGVNLATVSSGVTCCTLQSTEHKVRLHDSQCEVNLYDTISEKVTDIMSQTRPRARNIVIGESGSGKNSVINAITQAQRAETSSSAAGCTFCYQKHEVEISGENYILFDTVGLDEGTGGTVPAAEAEAKLKSLLRGLMSPRSDGIGLLVYCVGCGKDSGRISSLVRNYSRVYSTICRKKVPIVVVATGLESYEPNMESWWSANKDKFAECGMDFKDHACVTTLGDSSITESERLRIAESRQSLRTLIVKNYVEWAGDASWFNLLS